MANFNEENQDSTKKSKPQNGIAIEVPFAEKDEAKALGARWNAEIKKWYIPQGVDELKFKKWLKA